MILLSMIPLGYVSLKRSREFKKIRNEIMSMTGGTDIGFTPERYSENRDAFTSYALPVFFVILTIFMALPFGKSMEDIIPINMYAVAFYMAVALLHDLFNFKKETVVYLQDILTEEHLESLRKLRTGLNYGYILYFLDNNEEGTPIKKKYIKELSSIPILYSRKKNITEYFEVLEDMKNSLSVGEYKAKKEELEKRRLELDNKMNEAVDWVFVALGKKDSPEDEKKKLSESQFKLKKFLKEDEENSKEIELLPTPILELQELVKNSVDEEVKKEAEEALRVANELFDKSKERKESSKKEFVRMNQKSIIRTALDEMHKY